jgi:hypothetical protein
MRFDRRPVMAAAALVIILATVRADGAPLFFDDFQPASSQWGDESGIWSDADGSYRPTQTQFSYSGLGLSLSDYTVELDINDVHDGGVFLRSDFNGGGFNGVTLITGGNGGGGTGLYWHVWVNGNSGAILNPTSSLFAQGDDIHIRIEVSGNVFSAFLNGSTVAATTLTDSTYTAGDVALFNLRVGQGFDNFQITPEPGTIALSLIGVVVLAARRTRDRRAALADSTIASRK